MYKRKRKEKKKEKDLIYERKRNGDIILEITYFPHWGNGGRRIEKWRQNKLSAVDFY